MRRWRRIATANHSDALRCGCPASPASAVVTGICSTSPGASSDSANSRLLPAASSASTALPPSKPRSSSTRSSAHHKAGRSLRVSLVIAKRRTSDWAKRDCHQASARCARLSVRTDTPSGVVSTMPKRWVGTAWPCNAARRDIKVANSGSCCSPPAGGVGSNELEFKMRSTIWPSGGRYKSQGAKSPANERPRYRPGRTRPAPIRAGRSSRPASSCGRRCIAECKTP